MDISLDMFIYITKFNVIFGFVQTCGNLNRENDNKLCYSGCAILSDKLRWKLWLCISKDTQVVWDVNRVGLRPYLWFVQLPQSGIAWGPCHESWFFQLGWLKMCPPKTPKKNSQKCICFLPGCMDCKVNTPKSPIFPGKIDENCK